MILETKEPNHILNQPRRVGSKTALNFRDGLGSLGGVGHDGKTVVWKGERREGGAHAHLGRNTEHRSTGKGILKGPAKRTAQHFVVYFFTLIQCPNFNVVEAG
jgi:hypothetical protein